MSDREPSEAEKALAAVPEVQQVVGASTAAEPFMVNYRGKARHILEACAETGEPIFVFRARDIFSVRVIADYLREVERYGPSDYQFQEDISRALEEFKAWQHAHTSLVRYPD